MSYRKIINIGHNLISKILIIIYHISLLIISLNLNLTTLLKFLNKKSMIVISSSLLINSLKLNLYKRNYLNLIISYQINQIISFKRKINF
jgi:hypothetical protein